jgi:hypothetical protein
LADAEITPVVSFRGYFPFAGDPTRTPDFKARARSLSVLPVLKISAKTSNDTLPVLHQDAAGIDVGASEL